MRARVKPTAVAFTLLVNQPTYPTCGSSHMMLHKTLTHNTAMENKGYLILLGFITEKNCSFELELQQRYSCSDLTPPAQRTVSEI